MDISHLPNGDAAHRHEQEDDTPQTSRSEQESEQERETITSMFNNGDLMHNQYDGTFDSDDRLQQWTTGRCPDLGEDINRKHYLDEHREPCRGDIIQCTHSEHDACTGYPWCLPRDTGRSKKKR